MSGDRRFAIKVLEEKGAVVLRCNGNSMRPLIAPKEAIYIRKVAANQLRIGDAVFCRVNGGLQVHKITAIDKANERWQIGNNHGHINGWVSTNAIFGLAVMVEDRILVSNEELAKR
jgi:phage repressor protein C with HTH and peptisase S24 domain